MSKCIFIHTMKVNRVQWCLDPSNFQNVSAGKWGSGLAATRIFCVVANVSLYGFLRSFECFRKTKIQRSETRYWVKTTWMSMLSFSVRRRSRICIINTKSEYWHCQASVVKHFQSSFNVIVIKTLFYCFLVTYITCIYYSINTKLCYSKTLKLQYLTTC